MRTNRRDMQPEPSLRVFSALGEVNGGCLGEEQDILQVAGRAVHNCVVIHMAKKKPVAGTAKNPALSSLDGEPLAGRR